MKEIRFGGTIAEWKEIGHNSVEFCTAFSPGSYTVKCGDGDTVLILE